MDVWDDPDKYPGSVSEEAQKRFQENYLRPLGNDARYVRLESGFRSSMQELHADDSFGRNAHEREQLWRSY
jgi:hypothetical protein